jgi:hypothetical protein
VLTVGDGIKVKASTLGEKLAGRGAFVDRSVGRGELITEYAGPRLWYREDACKLPSTTHVISLRPFGHDDQYIDGLRDPVSGEGGASFINKHQAKLCNAEFVYEYGSVFAKATRHIVAGEEIFVNYGIGSGWEAHGGGEDQACGAASDGGADTSSVIVPLTLSSIGWKPRSGL